jgi:hypothetical protein
LICSSQQIKIKSNETYDNTPNENFHSQNRNTKDVSLQPTYIGFESTTLGKAYETPWGWHWEHIGEHNENWMGTICESIVM